MTEIKEKEKIYLDEFDIHVNPYLTYDQIEQIVKVLKSEDEWMVYQQNIDMLILFHVTDLGKERIEELGHEILLTSGLIDAVKKEIINIDQLYQAIEYTQSTQRALLQIIKKLPDTIQPLIEKMSKYGKTSKK